MTVVFGLFRPCLYYYLKKRCNQFQDDKSDEAVFKKNERVTFLARILKLACLTMVVDMKVSCLVSALATFSVVITKRVILK